MSERLVRLRQTLTSLQEYIAEPIVTKRDRAGVVRGFEMAFELLWKSLQDEIAERGFSERGPRPVSVAGIKAGLLTVEEEPEWRAMLEDRNLAAHVYREDWAIGLVERIERDHLPRMEALARKLGA